MRLLFSIIAITLCAYTADAQTFLGKLRQSEQGKGHVTVSQSADIDALVNGSNTQQKQQTTQQQSANTQRQDVTKQTSTQQTTVKEPVHTQLVAPPTKTKTQDAGPKDNNTTAKQQTTTPATKQQAVTPAPKQQTVTPTTKEHEATATKEKEKEKEHSVATQPAKDRAVTSPAKEKEEEETTVVDTRKKVMSRSYKTQGYRIQVFSGGNSRKDRQKAETAGVMMKSNFPNEPIYVHFYSPSWKCRMGNYKSVYEARKILAQVKKLGYTQACIVKGPISVQY